MDVFAALLGNMPFSPSALVLVAFLAAVILAVLLTPVAMRLARTAGVMDQPHARRVHTKPTPRWGGLAMYAAFAVTVLLIMPLRAKFFPSSPDAHEAIFNSRIIGILVCGALITALGALDDKYSLPAKVKLLGQIAIAVLLTLPFFGVRMIVAFDIPFIGIHEHQISIWREAMGYIFTVVWVVAITNTINLIDGLDGLAAGVSGLASLTFVAIALLLKPQMAIGEAILAAGVAGACIGFLRYNFNPAKVFMGDAGSHFLGFTIAALSILQNWKVAAGITIAIPVFILAVPIFDTAFAIVRRLRRGQPIFSPDKGHLHHRLLNLGMNQRQVVLCIYLLTVAGCVLALFLSHIRLKPYQLLKKPPTTQQQTVPRPPVRDTE